MSGIQLFGFGRAIAQLERYAAAVDGEDEAAVEATSDHAVHVEFGTRYRQATPFFRPGLKRTRTEDLGGPAELFDLVFGERSTALAVAELAETNVEAVIAEKGLIDSGDLLASVQAVED